MDRSLVQGINVAGLFVNAVGATLLIFFTSPGLDVTDAGEGMIGWKNEPTPDQRAANLRKYRKHKYGFKAGVVLLTIGYVLQLIAATIG